MGCAAQVPRLTVWRTTSGEPLGGERASSETGTDFESFGADQTLAAIANGIVADARGMEIKHSVRRNC